MYIGGVVDRSHVTIRDRVHNHTFIDIVGMRYVRTRRIMEFNNTMFDTRFAIGTMLDIVSNITGETDETTKKPAFEKTKVTYKVNIANCTLKNILEYAMDAIRIKVANATRPQGLVAVQKLNGSVVNLAELNERRAVVKLTPAEQASASLEKMSEDEIAVLLAKIKTKMSVKK